MWPENLQVLKTDQSEFFSSPAGSGGSYGRREQVSGEVRQVSVENWMAVRLRRQSPFSPALLDSASPSLASPADPPLLQSSPSLVPFFLGGGGVVVYIDILMAWGGGKGVFIMNLDIWIETN